MTTDTEGIQRNTDILLKPIFPPIVNRRLQKCTAYCYCPWFSLSGGREALLLKIPYTPKRGLGV